MLARNATFTVIAVSLIFRLVLSQTLGFGVDESYMLAQASQFQLSYLDHPPLHVWLAGLSLEAFGVSKWVRLPFVLCFSFTSYVLFLITRKLFDDWAGFWAVFALNISAFFVISPAMMVVPDGLLLLFLALTVWQFMKLDKNPKSFIILGLYIGLMGLAKYHGAIIALSLFVYIVIYERDLLKNPWLYVAAIVALTLQTPVIYWNMTHEWASFTFQAGRGGFNGFKPNQFVEMILGQFLWLLPWVFVPLLITIKRYWRAQKLLVILALPLILLFTLTPLWGARGLPHWTMPGWLLLFPLLGAWLSQRPLRQVKIWAWFSALFLAIILPLLTYQARTGIIALDKDPTLEAYDWQLTSKNADFIITDSWIAGGKIWVSLSGKIPVYVASKDKRNFGIGRKELTGTGLYVGFQPPKSCFDGALSKSEILPLKRKIDEKGITLYIAFAQDLKKITDCIK